MSTNPSSTTRSFYERASQCPWMGEFVEKCPWMSAQVNECPYLKSKFNKEPEQLPPITKTPDGPSGMMIPNFPKTD